MNEPKVTELAPGIIVVDHFMAEAECESWIAFSEQRGYHAATITTGQGQQLRPTVRNNERYIYDSNSLAAEMWERIAPYVPDDISDMEKCGLNERWRFYKYHPGQRFRKHRDGIFYRSINEWSAYTFMIYLNEVDEGGATNFGELSISPSIGKALIFSHQLTHEGAEVTAGVKYVMRTDVMFKRRQQLDLPQ